MILTSEREVPARNERGVRGMRAREASVPPASKLKLCSHRLYPSPSTEGKVIGVDLGLKYFAITRDGTKVSKYDNPRHLDPHEKNLKRKQQKLASDSDNEYAMIDSTIVRAHQHSAGAKGGCRGPSY